MINVNREEWLEVEDTLREPMRRLRVALRSERSPEWRRRQLIAEFARMHRRPRGWLPWAIGVAAAVSLALTVTPVWRGTPWNATGLGQRTGVEAACQELLLLDELMDQKGFTPVPYEMPLAGGESLYVLRTRLNRASLVRMGVNILLGYPNDFEADVLVGQDGFPRAVRVVIHAEL